MKSCIKLGGSLINHEPTIIEIAELIQEGEWDFLFGAGSEFSYVLKEDGIKFDYKPNKYGIKERVIDGNPNLVKYALKELLLPIQSRRIEQLINYFCDPKNVHFIGPIHKINENLININPDTRIYQWHDLYQKCKVYAIKGSSKKHFDPLLVPKGNVEIRWVPKYS